MFGVSISGRLFSLAFVLVVLFWGTAPVSTFAEGVRQGEPTGRSRLAQAKDAPASSNEAGPVADDPRLRNPPPPRAEPTIPPPRTGEELAALTFKTPYEVWLTLLTVVLAVSLIGLFCYVNRRDVADSNFSRHFIILSVIFSALFLIVAGYTEKQTAPVFGLLGTIIGYLFGMASGQRGRREPEDSKPKP